MHKNLIALSAAILLLLAAGCHAAAPAIPADVLRLHILANSDSPQDQRVKLCVRDALLEYMRGFDSQSSDGARMTLLSHGEQLLSVANAVLLREGAGYRAQLQSGRFDFPDLIYGEDEYPAGEYNALRVVLGDGSGQNWWCVMFPPLCMVDIRSAKPKRTGRVELRSALLDLFK